MKYTLIRPSSKENYSLKYYEENYKKYRFIHSLDENDNLVIKVVNFPGNNSIKKDYEKIHLWMDKFYDQWAKILGKEYKFTQHIPLEKLTLFVEAIKKVKGYHDKVDFRLFSSLLGISVQPIYVQPEPFKNRYNTFFKFEWYVFELFASLLIDNGSDFPVFHKFRLKMLPFIVDEILQIYDHMQVIRDIENYYQCKKNDIPPLAPITTIFLANTGLREQIGDLIIEIEKEILKDGESSLIVKNKQKELTKLLKEHKLIIDLPSHIQFFCQRLQDYNSIHKLKQKLKELISLPFPDTDEKKSQAFSLFTEIGEFCCNRKLSKQMRATLEQQLPLLQVIQIRDGIEHCEEHGWNKIINEWLSNAYINEGITWNKLKESYKEILVEINKIIDNKYAHFEEYLMELYNDQYNRRKPKAPKQPTPDEIKKFTEGGDLTRIKSVLDGKEILSEYEIMLLRYEAQNDPENSDFIYKLLKINRHYTKERIYVWMKKLPLQKKDIEKFVEIVNKLPSSNSKWLNALNNLAFFPSKKERDETADLIIDSKNKKDFLRITEILYIDKTKFDALYRLSKKFEQSKGETLTRLEIMDLAVKSLRYLIAGPLHEHIIHDIFGHQIPSEPPEKLYKKIYQNCQKELDTNPEFHAQIYYHNKRSLGLLKKIVKYPEAQKFTELLSKYHKLKRLRNILAHGDYTFNISNSIGNNMEYAHVAEDFMGILTLIRNLENIKLAVEETHRTISYVESLAQEKAERELLEELQKSNELKELHELEALHNQNIADLPYALPLKYVRNNVERIMQQRNQDIRDLIGTPDNKKPSSYRAAYEKAKELKTAKKL